jgi:CheY-like chemotaxis protein
VSENVISETRERLEKRLEELRPSVEEAAKIEAALKALKTGPAPPVTALDMLKPSGNGN